MKNFRLILVVFFAMIMAGYTMLAIDPPGMPYNVSASVEKGNGVAFIKLTWSIENSGTVPVMFHIYKADKKTDSRADFQRFAYVKNEVRGTNFQFNVTNLKSGTYSFYVTAVVYDQNSILESQPSQIVVVDFTFDQTPFIQIVSQPSPRAEKGTTWIYQVKCYSNIDCPIDMFSLLSPVPTGMRIDRNGLVTWVPENDGVYEVTIQAMTSCKINVQPAIQKFKLVVGNSNDQPFIRIVSQFNPYAEPGKQWVYQVIAESNVRCPILYDLIFQNPPQGFTFDRQKGFISWTPDQSFNGQVLSFGIRAFLECDVNVQTVQQVYIKIYQNQQNNPCAHIKGTVHYEDNTRVPDGQVRAKRINSDNRQYGEFYGYIKDGQYVLPCTPGTYILEIDGPSFVHEFYEDAETIEQADKIEVTCNNNGTVSEFIANFIVKKKPEPVHFNVSGNVSAESNGNPVLTMVEFIPVEFINGNRDKNTQVPYFATKTDQNGDYTISLPDNHVYIAHVPNVPGIAFMEQYYDKVGSPFEADLIELTGDVTDIDFVLKSHQVDNQNGLGGIVKSDSGDFVLKSRVIAYLVKAKDPNFTKRVNYTIETDNQGVFHFRNMIPGEYVLMSIPMDRSYVPGYYKMGQAAALKWREATRISVDNVMLTIVYEVRHRFRQGLRGIIRVDGVVTTASGMFKKLDNPQSNENPVPGAFVYVLDEMGNVSDFCLSNSDGWFEMLEVEQGANMLVVDMPGFIEYQQIISLDYSRNSKANVNIGIEQESLGNEQENKMISGEQIYPVPASDVIYLNNSSVQGDISVIIYDNLGSLVMNLVNKPLNQDEPLHVNISSLPSGIYYLKITNGASAKVFPFTVSR